MKWFLLISMLILSYDIAMADDEYAYKEVIAPNEVYSVGIGTPLIATKPCTHAEMLYKYEYMNIYQGDLITQLSYKGYNLGEAFTRHFVVWMANTQQRDIRDQYGMTPSESMTKVFEGDCTIAAGGSADECIPLLTITLDQPFEYGGYTIRVVIESSGVTAAQEVFFEQYRFRWQSCYATAEELGGWSQSDYAQFPITTLTVATPVVNLTGAVFNQDSVPIPGATIQMKSTDWPTPVVYSGVSDDNGNYSIRIEEGSRSYLATVSAPDCANYEETWWGTRVKDKTQWNFTLYDAVEYKAGRRATIIMPVTPDASWGRYFRLDRIEDSQLIFERELSPQANVPYVIFPDRDFFVDLSTLDLSIQAGKTSIPCVDFVGSFINYDFPTTDNQELIFLDETQDGGYELYYDEFGGYYIVGGGRIAALRACIIEDGWYGKDLVFHDGTSGIALSNCNKTTDVGIYDLQGRRVTKMKRGIYIKDGKKIIF